MTVGKHSPELAGAIAALSPNPTVGQADPRDALLVQAQIRGQPRSYQSVAWKGELLAGFAGERIHDEAGRGRQTGVNRYYRSDALREIAARLAQGFRISGLFSLEGVVAENGDFRLLDSIAASSAAPIAQRFGVVIARRWRRDAPAVRRTHRSRRGRAHLCLFQEWLRDPEASGCAITRSTCRGRAVLFQAMLDLIRRARPHSRGAIRDYGADRAVGHRVGTHEVEITTGVGLQHARRKGGG